MIKKNKKEIIVEELTRFNTPKLQQPHMFWNNKIVLVTKPKIAHSLCRKIFLGNHDVNVRWKMKELQTGFRVDPVTFKMTAENRYTNNTPEDEKWQDEYDNDAILIWDNILRGVDDRDLILLYRNPYEHFLSGFVQDTLFFDDVSKGGRMLEPLLRVWIDSMKDIKVGSAYKDKFINTLTQNQASFGGFIQLLELFPDITSRLLELLFKQHIERVLYTRGHYTRWLSFAFLLYESGRIDKSKIKFIDTYEDNLFNSLDPYVDKWPDFVNDERRQSNYKGKSPLYKVLDEMISHNSDWTNVIEHSIETDMIAYNKIKALTNDK